MRFPSRSVAALARFGLIALAVTACATGGDGLAPPASFTTLIPGVESNVSGDWKDTPAQDGSRLLFGRVTSHYGQYAENFQLLGQSLDASGNLVSQRGGRGPGGVPGFNSTYYEISRMAAADHYRVTVWSYSFIEDRGKVQ